MRENRGKKEGQVKENSRFFKKSRYFTIGLLILGVAIVVILLVLIITQAGVKKIRVGDVVSVDYVGYFEDGKVFDTSLEEVAGKNNIQREEFVPLKFRVGAGHVVSGFDEAVIGLTEGNTKKFEVPPEKAYGYRQEGLVLKDMKRDLYVRKYSNVTKAQFVKLFNKQPVLNEVLELDEVPWKLMINKIQDDDVFIENVLTVGSKVKLPGTNWEAVVKELVNDIITIRQNPVVGNFVAFPTSKGMVVGNVINVKEDTYDIDTNHPLAEKTLTFEITIVKIQET